MIMIYDSLKKVEHQKYANLGGMSYNVFIFIFGMIFPGESFVNSYSKVFFWVGNWQGVTVKISVEQSR